MSSRPAIFAAKTRHSMSLSYGTELKIGLQDDLLITDLINQKTEVAKFLRTRTRTRGRVKTQKGVVGSSMLEYLTEVANTTSVILTRLVGADCAVAIKLLWKKSDGAVVMHTLLRDSKSRRERGGGYLGEGEFSPLIPSLGIKDDFPYAENTAFEQLVADPNPNACFISNDLRALASKGGYKNSNDHWKQFYNCTGVVKIAGVEGDKRERIIGFLCVDSWSWPNEQPPEPIRDVLLKISQHVYNTLDLLVPEETAKGVNWKNIGFIAEDGRLIEADGPSQEKFQSSFELLQGQLNLSLQQREVRSILMDPHSAVAVLLGRAPLSEDVNMHVDEETGENLLALSTKEVEEVKNLQDALDKMSYEDVATRLKAIAPNNPYAEQLLKAAKKNNIIK